jgi:hypothetical protein
VKNLILGKVKGGRKEGKQTGYEKQQDSRRRGIVCCTRLFWATMEVQKAVTS